MTVRTALFGLARLPDDRSESAPEDRGRVGDQEMSQVAESVTSRARPRPGRLLRWFLKVPPLFYRLGLAGRLGARLLLLTTIGRRTGRRRTCGLNYVLDGETVYVVSGYGRTGWYRNLLADPHVEVRIGGRRWPGIARPVVDAAERRRALALLREAAPRQGPPRVLRGLARLVGLDYDAEVRRLDDPELDLPAVAIRPARAAGGVP